MTREHKLIVVINFDDLKMGNKDPNVSTTILPPSNIGSGINWNNPTPMLNNPSTGIKKYGLAKDFIPC